MSAARVADSEAEGSSVLVGLHTCGDLAPTMLRVFHHAGDAVHALVNVGCCYMKLSEEACPLSQLDTEDDAAADTLNSANMDVERASASTSTEATLGLLQQGSWVYRCSACTSYVACRASGRVSGRVSG